MNVSGFTRARRHFLQPVVAHGRGRAERRFHVAFFEQPALLRGMRPDARKAIRLQLQLYRQRIRLTANRSPALMHAPFDPQQFLHVMSQFVREHVGLRELARARRTAD